MNQDILEGKWSQLKGSLKQWWGKLTDDDIEQMHGNFDKLAGKIQERYGRTREHAQQECRDRLVKFQAEHNALTHLAAEKTHTP